MVRPIVQLLVALALQVAATATSAESAAPCAIATHSQQVGSGTIVAGAGPEVLLIHGLFANKEQWSALACLLADAGYRTIAVDLPGYGASDGFSLPDYSLENQVDKLHTLMTRLDIRQIDLAGNSMGGAIASLYASRYPYEVRSVAFIGSPLGIIGWSPEMRNAIYRGINPFIPITEPQLDLELGLLFVTPPAIPESGKKAIVANYALHNRHYVQVWDIVNLYGDVLMQKPPARITTLIIWGDDDRIYDVAGAQKLHRRIPWSEMHHLPHAGHLLHIENARDVAPIYVGFLASGLKAVGLGNPASQYCVDKGGRLTLEKNGTGGQFGVCTFADNRQCEEWAMMRDACPVGGIKVTGSVTPAARYCVTTGGTYKVTSGNNTANEQGTCAFGRGRTCPATAHFDGTCMRESDASAAPRGEASAQTTAAAKPIRAFFACDAGKTVNAVFTNGTQSRVRLTLSDGREMSVPQALSGSGARYASGDESFVFWNKGNTAFIEERGKTTYSGCTTKN